MNLSPITPTLSILLASILIAPPGWSQTMSSAAASSSLQIKVVDSDGPVAVAGATGAKGYFLQVTDANGMPVPEAAVAVRLPESGATGLFADGSHSAVVYTDSSGRAHVGGIQWAATPGPMAIRVTASKGEDHAGILIEQTLTTGAAASQPGISETVPGPSSPPRLEPAPALAAVSNNNEAADVAPLNTIVTGPDPAPIRPALRAMAPTPGVSVLRTGTPSVSVSTDGSGPAYHGSFNKKWIWIGLTIAAAAGAAYAMSSVKAGSTSSSSSSISIGAPSVSVGHP